MQAATPDPAESHLQTEQELDEGIVERAWTDLKQVSVHWWRFRIPAAVLTAGFAAWGSLLPSKPGTGERVGLAIGGTVGGALVIGALAFVTLLVGAPIRQRNELRATLARLRPNPDEDDVDPIAAIEQEIAAGEQLLARADDPTWSDFQRDHAVNEWEARVQGVIRDLAPR